MHTHTNTLLTVLFYVIVIHDLIKTHFCVNNSGKIRKILYKKQIRLFDAISPSKVLKQKRQLNWSVHSKKKLNSNILKPFLVGADTVYFYNFVFFWVFISINFYVFFAFHWFLHLCWSNNYITITNVHPTPSTIFFIDCRRGFFWWQYIAKETI